MANKRSINVNDEYSDKVKKLIPAEVSAGFLAINSSIAQDDRLFIYALGFFIVLIPICAAYLYYFEEVNNFLQIFFTSVIAFPLWAANIAVDRFDISDDLRFLPAAGLVIATLVAPILVKMQDAGG